MKMNIKDVLEHRRSYYAIGDISPVENSDIEDIMRFALLHVPSAFNSQSTRIVLLLRDNHKRFWDMMKECLRNIVPENAFAATESKINTAFAGGYGTVLFFEEQNVVKELQNKFPLYAENFPIWSEQTSAMHQIVIWAMLEEVGFGASLQHYNNLIDEEIRTVYELPDSWKLIAEMPFGNPLQKPDNKTFEPIKDRMRIFI